MSKIWCPFCSFNGELLPGLLAFAWHTPSPDPGGCTIVYSSLCSSDRALSVSLQPAQEPSPPQHWFPCFIFPCASTGVKLNRGCQVWFCICLPHLPIIIATKLFCKPVCPSGFRQKLCILASIISVTLAEINTQHRQRLHEWWPWNA